MWDSVFLLPVPPVLTVWNFITFRIKHCFLSHENLSSALDTEEMLSASHPRRRTFPGPSLTLWKGQDFPLLWVYSLLNARATSQGTWGHHLTPLPLSTKLFQRTSERALYLLSETQKEVARILNQPLSGSPWKDGPHGTLRTSARPVLALVETILYFCPLGMDKFLNGP